MSHEPVCPQSSRMVGLGHVSQAAGVNMNGGFVSERSGLLLARCCRRSVTLTGCCRPGRWVHSPVTWVGGVTAYTCLEELSNWSCWWCKTSLFERADGPSCSLTHGSLQGPAAGPETKMSRGNLCPAGFGPHQILAFTDEKPIINEKIGSVKLES